MTSQSSFPTVHTALRQKTRTLKKRTARHSARISISFRQSCRQWKTLKPAAFQLTVTFDKLGSFRGEDPRADRIKAMRDMVKKEIGKLQKLAGDAEDQKFTEEIAATTGTVVYLFLAVQSFEKTYSAKKREKNVLDVQ